MNIVPREELPALVDKLGGERKRIVFTNGCFDLIHPGHLHLLEEASRAGDVLVVGINDDDSVRRLKGEGRPIHDALERAEVLLSLRWVDYVTVFAEDTPMETIRIIRPDVLAKGAEYEPNEIVGAGFVRSYGGELLRVTMKPGFSTTALLDRSRSRTP